MRLTDCAAPAPAVELAAPKCWAPALAAAACPCDTLRKSPVRCRSAVGCSDSEASTPLLAPESTPEVWGSVVIGPLGGLIAVIEVEASRLHSQNGDGL